MFHVATKCSLHHAFAINILNYATNFKLLLLGIDIVLRFCWWFLLRDWGPIWFLVINTVFNLSCAFQWHCSTDDLTYNNLWKISLDKGVVWSPSCDYGFCTLGKETHGPTYDLKLIFKYQELAFKRKSFMCTGFICSVILKDTWRGSSLDSEGVVLIG